MRKKVEHPQDGKSIKTVLIYAAVVLFVIAISLTFKAITIMQQSKFKGEHFTLAVAQNDTVKEIIVFNPDDSSMSVLTLKGSSIPLAGLPKRLGISPDGQITTKDTSSDLINDEDISQTLLKLGLRYAALKTNLTIFDIGRLSLYAKNLPPNKITIKEVEDTDLAENPQLERTLVSFFSDDVVATENISIQIINASGVSGMAQRLEYILLHQGANVVSVTGSQHVQAHSQIKYFGDKTYTLDKINNLLGFTVSKLDKETIAKIVIIIGEDNKNTSIF
jgi:hypothetical protein